MIWNVFFKVFRNLHDLAWLAMVWLGVCVGMNCCELGPWHTMANTQTLSWPSINSLCPCVFFRSKFAV